MRKLLVLVFAMIMMLGLIAGCGDNADTEENSAAGDPAEVQDSTRLDEAVEEVVDSAKATMETAVDSAAAAAKEALGN